MDDRARQNARRHLTEQSVVSATQVLADKLRFGQITLRRLAMASWLGDPAARNITPPTNHFTYQFLVLDLTKEEIEQLIRHLDRLVPKNPLQANHPSQFMAREAIRNFQTVGFPALDYKETFPTSALLGYVMSVMGKEDPQAYEALKRWLADLLLWGVS